MKRSKKLCLLLGLLTVLCVATIAVLQVEEYKEKIETSQDIVLELDGDTVETLSWEYEDTSLAFHRGEDGAWLYDEDTAFPVDGEKIGERLDLFSAFGVSFIIQDVEDYGQYGLEDPVCTIRLTTAEESYEILLGDYSTLDEERYVSIGDGNVYLVETDPLDYFSAGLSDMILNDSVPAIYQAEEITFAGAADYTARYEADSTASYCAADVYFLQEDGESLPLDTGLVESYLSSLSALDLSSYATYNATEEQLASYGLDDPELTVTVSYVTLDEDGEETAPEEFVLHLSRDPEERAAAEAEAETETETDADTDTAGEEAEEEEITAYARAGESQIVYRITGEEYQALMAASYDDLRHREVLTADFGDIRELRFTLEGEEYTLTLEPEEDSEEGGILCYYGEETVDLTDLRSAVEALSADSFTTEAPGEKEEIRFTAVLDNENFPQVEVILYRYDGSHCLAVVDGESVSLVPRSQVVDLIEALNAIVLE